MAGSERAGSLQHRGCRQRYADAGCNSGDFQSGGQQQGQAPQGGYQQPPQKQQYGGQQRPPQNQQTQDQQNANYGAPDPGNFDDEILF